jgi:hypothetical protein
VRVVGGRLVLTRSTRLVRGVSATPPGYDRHQRGRPGPPPPEAHRLPAWRTARTPSPQCNCRAAADRVTATSCQRVLGWRRTPTRRAGSGPFVFYSGPVSASWPRGRPCSCPPSLSPLVHVVGCTCRSAIGSKERWVLQADLLTMLQSRPNSDHQSQIQQMSRSSGTVVRSARIHRFDFVCTWGMRARVLPYLG